MDIPPSTEIRWWADYPRHWIHRLEQALASDNVIQMGLAWSVILATGGRQRGDMADFCEIVGLETPVVSGALGGDRKLGNKTIQRICVATGVCQSLFYRGCHPYSLAVGFGGVSGVGEGGAGPATGGRGSEMEKQKGRPEASLSKVEII